MSLRKLHFSTDAEAQGGLFGWQLTLDPSPLASRMVKSPSKTGQSREFHRRPCWSSCSPRGLHILAWLGGVSGPGLQQPADYIGDHAMKSTNKDRGVSAHCQSISVSPLQATSVRYYSVFLPQGKECVFVDLAMNTHHEKAVTHLEIAALPFQHLLGTFIPVPPSFSLC